MKEDLWRSKRSQAGKETGGPGHERRRGRKGGRGKEAERERRREVGKSGDVHGPGLRSDHPKSLPKSGTDLSLRGKTDLLLGGGRDRDHPSVPSLDRPGPTEPNRLGATALRLRSCVVVLVHPGKLGLPLEGSGQCHQGTGSNLHLHGGGQDRNRDLRLLNKGPPDLPRDVHLLRQRRG